VVLEFPGELGPAFVVEVEVETATGPPTALPPSGKEVMAEDGTAELSGESRVASEPSTDVSGPRTPARASVYPNSQADPNTTPARTEAVRTSRTAPGTTVVNSGRLFHETPESGSCSAI
jgi:hypothetical protein